MLFTAKFPDAVPGWPSTWTKESVYNDILPLRPSGWDGVSFFFVYL